MNELKSSEKEKLYYTLFSSEKTSDDIIEGNIVYSVLVYKQEGGITTDYCFLYDVSRDKNKANEIMSKLRENEVYPFEAFEVFQNILS